MGLEKWKRNIENKSTLGWYKGKEKPRMELAYDGSKREELFFKARTGSLELNVRTHSWNQGSQNDLVLKTDE